ncbi:MAG: hypothetical protein Q8K60_03450 [Parachlamydiaceae bacterium]|nr:hypothetical protein [Parachlamydiaceae bacterium]
MKKTIKKAVLLCVFVVAMASCQNEDCSAHIAKLEGLCKDYVDLSYKLREAPNDLKLISQYENLWKEILLLKEIPPACKDDKDFAMQIFAIARKADSSAIGVVELQRLAVEEQNKKAVKELEDNASADAKRAERDLQVYDSTQKANNK